MKRITVTLAIIMLFVIVGLGQDASTKAHTKPPAKPSKQPAKHADAVVRIKGHVMGETVAEFIAIEPALKKQLDECSPIPVDPDSCIAWGDASDGIHQPLWRFKKGILVTLSMTIRGAIYPNVRDDLTKKFGFKPLEATLKQQNVYGARWNKTSSDWNGTKVSGLLENDENPSDPTLTFLLVLNSDGETIKTTNPLD